MQSFFQWRCAFKEACLIFPERINGDSGSRYRRFLIAKEKNSAETRTNGSRMNPHTFQIEMRMQGRSEMQRCRESGSKKAGASASGTGACQLISLPKDAVGILYSAEGRFRRCLFKQLIFQRKGTRHTYCLEIKHSMFLVRREMCTD